MPLPQGSTSPTVHRLGSFFLSGALAVVLVLFAAGCGQEAGKEPGEPSAAREAASDDAAPSAFPGGQDALPETVVTVYRSPTCGCCQKYEGYLEENGFEVESIRTEDLGEIKDGLGIPEDMRSCHTAIVEEYFVEGHVPVEAIWKLLEEQPEIDGIALPGMPSGSPGMGGDKEQPFIVYSIADGRVDEFMTL